ncbi:MAG: thioredoxin domain-containing protein [Candidatus Diapherotrites archaeon]
MSDEKGTVGENNLLPISIVIASLIVAGTVFMVGGNLSGQITGLTVAIDSIEVTGGGGTGAIVVPPLDNGGDNGNDTPPAPPAADVGNLADDDDAVRGPEDAKITIVEFSDFECPFCGRAIPTVEQVMEEYEGDVKLIFKDFPLSFHQNAQKAAEAAECAGEQDKFWEMHDLLFDNQTALAISDLKQYAVDLGLDTGAFNSCLDNGDMAAEVSADFAAGQAAGVSGTPTFFINGQKIVGAQPFSAFKAIIDAELS